jgi:hypothetical protein
MRQKKEISMDLSSSTPWRIENIGPMYSVILGYPPSHRISEEYRQQAIQVCSSIFESFTVSKVDGFFRGQAEDSLVFQVATPHPEKIDQLAAHLAATFDQEGVGTLLEPGQTPQAIDALDAVRWPCTLPAPCWSPPTAATSTKHNTWARSPGWPTFRPPDAPPFPLPSVSPLMSPSALQNAIK